ncbi:SRPBCC family protein [Tundrisphaera lichenicola]|uniref:SRPBCC family protein n=1 Tax=Tundrisphaera lichenicola TaxID=2029860 RepID=UPI003EB72F5E
MSFAHPPRVAVQGIRDYEEEHRPTSGINVGNVERWASAIGGTLLMTHGLKRGSFGGLALAILGGSLVYRGLGGHCPAYELLQIDTSDKHRAEDQEHPFQGRLIKHSTTIEGPAEDLYRFWREQTNAPRFMSNVESVTMTGEKTSHWVAKGPMGRDFAWDSEIINEEPGRLFAWKSLPGSDLNHAGTVRFEPATGGRGTVVTLEISYEPPAGTLGVVVAKLLGEDPDGQTRENLRRFKQLMETGVIATVEGQTSGRVDLPTRLGS